MYGFHVIKECHTEVGQNDIHMNMDNVAYVERLADKNGEYLAVFISGMTLNISANTYDAMSKWLDEHYKNREVR